MNRTVKEWLIILASLADETAATLLILLVLRLFGVSISVPIIVFLVLFFVAAILIMHWLVIPALRRRKTEGADGLIGLEGRVVESLEPEGLVKIKNEYWKARATDGTINAGERIEVMSLEGLVLTVRLKGVTAMRS